MFIKFEKKEKHDGDPRGIQYRATPYTARLAKYIVPLEKSLYRKHYAVNHGFRCMAKGMNALDRGEELWSMFCHYDGPYIYLIDHSRFDSRVNRDLLQVEHWFYLQVFPDRWLKYLLQQQVKNRGRTRNGLRYSCIARRMSGDANTALGNCLINYALLRAKFGEQAIIFLDGDDSVVFMPGQVNVDFSDTGMVSKVEVVRHFQEIEFCQSRPVYTSVGWVMCREPLRALSRSLYKLGALPYNWKDYLATIGIGEGLCSPEMPIISRLAEVYRSFGGEYKWYFIEYRPVSAKCVSRFLMPTHASRSSFAIAFDMDCSLQLLYEKEIKAMVLYAHNTINNG